MAKWKHANQTIDFKVLVGEISDRKVTEGIKRKAQTSSTFPSLTSHSFIYILHNLKSW
jgi:hypothetical protein